jgi:hypothetical protein
MWLQVDGFPYKTPRQRVRARQQSKCDYKSNLPLPRVLLSGTGDLAKARICGSAVGSSKLMPIEKVEELCPELDVYHFSDFCHLTRACHLIRYMLRLISSFK